MMSKNPLRPLSEHPDVALAVGVAAIVGMLILPMPALLLDGMLATNLAFAAVILVAILLSPRPLSVSTFPTLLLITTLFRLALNVSTTRMILAKGTAGGVVEAFGNFVIRGDIVVGLVVFLVITLVQFLVIGKGAERVAEVGARFTLDAMPGKQMSIDAALRAGSITEEQAQKKRDDLGRESQFYGAMDGAMKFVKGDAIAGLVVTALNLVAGLVIGVVRNGLEVGEAAEVYTLLTVGDGLVSQIPALLITLSAGVLTTRVAGSGENTSLGGSLQAELLSSPKVLAIGAAFALTLGLIPGLPLLPFLAIASLLALTAYFGHKKARAPAPKDDLEVFRAKLVARTQQAEKQKSLADRMAPAVLPLAVDCDPLISAALELEKGDHCQLIEETVPALREVLYEETGVLFPAIRARSNAGYLGPKRFSIRVRNVPVYEATLEPGKIMVCDSPDRVRRLGVEVTPINHPVTGLEFSLVDQAHEAAMEQMGLQTFSAPGILCLHLMRVLKKHTSDFLGLQETGHLVERLEKVYPTLVREVVPKIISLANLAEILRRLVDEKVSVRDLKTILECLAQAGEIDSDRVALTERVRAALRLQLAYAHAGSSNSVQAIFVAPEVEDVVASAIAHVPGGSYLALEPELQRAVVLSVIRTVQPVLKAGVMPVIITSASIRRYLHKLIEFHVPGLPVLSFQELPRELDVQPLGHITMPDELPAVA